MVDLRTDNVCDFRKGEDELLDWTFATINLHERGRRASFEKTFVSLTDFTFSTKTRIST